MVFNYKSLFCLFVVILIFAGFQPVFVFAQEECVGDTNTDFVVNVEDLTNVIMNWGRVSLGINPQSSDVNGDRKINQDDLNLVIANWGECEKEPDIPEEFSIDTFYENSYPMGTVPNGSG